MEHEKRKNLYIASCERDGGIYQYQLREDGKCRFVSFTQVDRPMYMVSENGRMYIVLREPWHNGESGVIVYDMDSEGRLINPSDIMSTRGEVGCHIMVHKGEIYCANYSSGSFIRMPDMLVQHNGCGENPVRQDKAHVHFVGLTPDERYIIVADLGLDTIFLYERKELKLYSKVQVSPGHGVRHLVFSEDGRYLFSVNELASTVAAFFYEAGKLRLSDVKSAVPVGFRGENAASAVRRKGEKLYVSNRGANTIAVFLFENNKLTLVDTIDCYGRTPRDFILTDHYIICANQDSDAVMVLDENRNFEVIEQIKIKKPVCICCTKTGY